MLSWDGKPAVKPTAGVKKRKKHAYTHLKKMNVHNECKDLRYDSERDDNSKDVATLGCEAVG